MVQECKMGKDMDLQERVRLKKADRSELYSLTPPFPKTNFLIELSNACNHACIFCTHQKMKRPVGRINKDFAYDILQQAFGNKRSWFLRYRRTIYCARSGRLYKKS